MSIHRRAAKRDTVEPEIIAAYIEVGASVYKVSGEGGSDLIVGFNGLNYLVEAKTGKGKLTPAQVEFRNNWQGQYDIARNAEEALRIIGL
jgi:hypothetical protein